MKIIRPSDQTTNSERFYVAYVAKYYYNVQEKRLKTKQK